ncbi:MAG: putative transcriptional regulator [Paraglaciecola sp.]|jgi:putative transcriptional regulator
MINFHPDIQQITDFAGGNCSANVALIISAHIDMCPLCQRLCMQAEEELAAEALLQPLAMAENLSNMMLHITQSPLAEPSPAKSPSGFLELEGRYFQLPRALHRCSEKTGNWSRLVGKLWQAPVDIGGVGQATFIYMEKGGRVPEHTHRGIESTLVIDGQFSDGLADYGVGDFTRMDSHNKHVPYSGADDGCLVFTILDKPLQFTSGIARLLNPFSHLFFKS